MKTKFYLLLTFVCVLPLLVLTDFALPYQNESGKWELQNQLVGRLNSISFSDKFNGWVVGDSGRVYQTIDGGKNWIKKDLQTSANLNCVFFIDYLNGWIVGGKNQGQVLENLDRIFKTNDGGETWTSYKNQKWEPVLRSIRFINKNLGWAFGYGLILKTTDGGEKWKMVPELKFNGSDLFYVNEKEGFYTSTSSGMYGSVYYHHINHSSDYGTTWESAQLDKEVKHLFFINEKIGWAIGSSCLFKTIDNGKTWTEKEVFSASSNLISIFFITEDIGWVCGSNFIAKSIDGGESWHQEEILLNKKNSYPNFASFCLIDENNGWAISNSYSKVSYICEYKMHQ
jgi:photosystem II stability/assembly factor-like uncharacterized protein